MSQDRVADSRDDHIRWGGWCHIASGFVAEIMGSAGFDWCCIDAQHGLLGEEHFPDMVRALEASGTSAFVRVRGPDREAIGRALDSGAEGVIVPSIRTLVEAQVALDACSFHPVGTRSWATTRAKLYPERLADLDRPGSSSCYLMIETKPALERVEEIVSLPGVTGLFVGPEDLKRELGVNDDGLMPALERIAMACRTAGLEAGGVIGTIPVSRWLALGYSFLALGADSTLLMEAAAAALRRGRDAR